MSDEIINPDQGPNQDISKEQNRIPAKSRSTHRLTLGIFFLLGLIIIIIGYVAFNRYNIYKINARDAQRQTDAHAIAWYLQGYYRFNQSYPDSLLDLKKFADSHPDIEYCPNENKDRTCQTTMSVSVKNNNEAGPFSVVYNAPGGTYTAKISNLRDPQTKQLYNYTKITNNDFNLCINNEGAKLPVLVLTSGKRGSYRGIHCISSKDLNTYINQRVPYLPFDMFY